MALGDWGDCQVICGLSTPGCIRWPGSGFAKSTLRAMDVLGHRHPSNFWTVACPWPWLSE